MTPFASPSSMIFLSCWRASERCCRAPEFELVGEANTGAAG